MATGADSAAGTVAATHSGTATAASADTASRSLTTAGGPADALTEGGGTAIGADGDRRESRQKPLAVAVTHTGMDTGASAEDTAGPMTAITGSTDSPVTTSLLKGTSRVSLKKLCKEWLKCGDETRGTDGKIEIMVDYVVN